MRLIPLLMLLLCGLLGGLLGADTAQAALRRGNLPTLSTGEPHDGTLSELWFSVLDPVAEVSYTLDLGVTMAMLRATNADSGTATALAPVGSNIAATFTTASDATRDHAFWIITGSQDAAWASFSAAANMTNAVWAVMDNDAIGNNFPGGRALQLSITQGTEEAVRNMTNQAFNLVQATPSAWIGNVNARPSHAVDGDVTNDLESSVAINGSSYDTKAANPDSYFGKVVSDLETLVKFTNPVGQSAWFYDITRSGSGQLLKVVVNEFDNLAGDAYWGFIAEAGSTGRFLLSYTTPRFVSQAETAAALTFENSFAHLAGVLSVASAVGHSDEVIGLADGFLRRLVSRPAVRAQFDSGTLQVAQGVQLAVSPVPEPAGWALMGLGLAGLGLWSRRRAG